MQNRENAHLQSDADPAVGQSSLMGRDILAATLLTIAAAVCIVVAWNGGSSVDPLKSGAPDTLVSEHQKPN